MNRMSKSWLFTINNPTEPLVSPQRFFETLGSKFLVYQLEIGEEGTRHLQGYAHWSGKKRGSTVKRLLGGRAHVEIRRGTHSEAFFFLHLFF